MPFTNDKGENQTSLQFQYEYKDFVAIRKGRDEATKEHNALYKTLETLMVEIEPEICFSPEMPDAPKFPLKHQKPYEYLIITHKMTDEEIKAELKNENQTPELQAGKRPEPEDDTAKQEMKVV